MLFRFILVILAFCRLLLFLFLLFVLLFCSQEYGHVVFDRMFYFRWFLYLLFYFFKEKIFSVGFCRSFCIIFCFVFVFSCVIHVSLLFLCVHICGIVFVCFFWCVCVCLCVLWFGVIHVSNVFAMYIIVMVIFCFSSLGSVEFSLLMV